MSEFDYNEAHEVAAELIKYFGEQTVLMKKGSGLGFDKYGEPIAIVSDSTINGTVTPLLDYTIEEIDSETIFRGDSFVFFDSEEKPEIGMMIEINDRVFSVVNIEELNSVSGVNVYRKLQLRS
jgi:hypothetical protein